MIHIHKTGAPIYCQGRRVILSRFDVDCPDTMTCAVVADFLHGGIAQSRPPKSRLNKEIVNDSGKTAERHAVAKGYYDVPVRSCKALKTRS